MVAKQRQRSGIHGLALMKTKISVHVVSQTGDTVGRRRGEKHWVQRRHHHRLGTAAAAHLGLLREWGMGMKRYINPTSSNELRREMKVLQPPRRSCRVMMPHPPAKPARHQVAKRTISAPTIVE